ncbi:hypothetical protein Drose_31745 [Dactylosporangium roseum]|uniref:Thiopeptide-type bacteriocin biosynthesis domain-containing protein n=1 Tax=Dactylosporangium roseum TaxID=47989 RepID=A0ABY5Z213_9ACTN|nr:hypothetical protein [Dactylosporangium roseum]UWZ35641.1 hypothetical protein Drose_31745 [Dactylosporangium roseum]
MYSLVSAPVLGFDLSRLQGGSAAADVLLHGLMLTQSDLDAVASARADDDWDRADLWRDVDAAAQERRAAVADTGTLTVIERAPLGTLDGLLHCLRYDVLDWTWGKRPARQSMPAPQARTPRQRQSPVASKATGVLSDAAAAAYLRELLSDESRRRLSAPWTAAQRALPERRHDLGPQQDDVRRLLSRVGALSPDEMQRLNKVTDSARPGLSDWAPAVHSASWAVFLSGRVRAGAAAQLLLVQALDRSGVPVADRAGGVWNLLSGAVQALMVRDLLDSATTRRLLDPYFTAIGPLAG